MLKRGGGAPFEEANNFPSEEAAFPGASFLASESAHACCCAVHNSAAVGSVEAAAPKAAAAVAGQRASVTRVGWVLQPPTGVDSQQDRVAEACAPQDE